MTEIFEIVEPQIPKETSDEYEVDISKTDVIDLGRWSVNRINSRIQGLQAEITKLQAWLVEVQNLTKDIKL